jgi:hypothetical protein
VEWSFWVLLWSNMIDQDVYKLVAVHLLRLYVFWFRIEDYLIAIFFSSLLKVEAHIATIPHDTFDRLLGN